MKKEHIRFCVNNPDTATYHTDGWKGCLYPINFQGWSYHLIFGEQYNGWFLCIPDWGIGAELAHPSNFSWNESSLIKSGVDEITAVCIAEALAVANEYLS